MSPAQDGLTFYFNQSDHAIPNRDFVAEMLLDIVPRIALPGISRDKLYEQPQIPLFYLQYAVLPPCSQSEFEDRPFGAEQSRMQKCTL